MKDALYREAENRVKLAAYFAKEMIETLGKEKAMAVSYTHLTLPTN